MLTSGEYPTVCTVKEGAAP